MFYQTKHSKLVPHEDLAKGFTHSCDAIVIGSGAGGAVAAFNLAKAGMKVALVEAGPHVKEAEMTRDAPTFMARYMWEGGLRLMGGNAFLPAMQGRMLGGSTVVNSAIMFELPDWVRSEWEADSGIPFLKSKHMADAYKRVWKRLKVVRTPDSAQGPKNWVVRDALTAAGLKANPLPRAVQGCNGCGDCLTGCFEGNKQSVDRSYIVEAQEHDCEIFTNCHVDKIITQGTKATGIVGSVVSQPNGARKLGRFRIYAPLVIVSAGATHTPVILQKSNIHAGNTVGRSLYAHVTGGLFGFMEEDTLPWFGASQGYGAFSEDLPGVKFESLWAPESVMSVKWGEVGIDYLSKLEYLRRAVCLAVVHRGKVKGKVKPRFDGSPNMKLHIYKSGVHVVNRALHQATKGLLKVGAEYVFSGINGVRNEMRKPEHADDLLSTKIDASDCAMTLNHLFGSVRMGADEKEYSVDFHGKVRGLDNLYVCDASIFPSPSAVNPQGTIMAMTDLITRRLGDYKDSEYVLN